MGVIQRWREAAAERRRVEQLRLESMGRTRVDMMVKGVQQVRRAKERKN